MSPVFKTIVIASLAIFLGLVGTWQVLHYSDPPSWPSVLSITYLRGQRMSLVTDIVERERQIIPASGDMRRLDLELPPDAHVFMADMIGPTNYDKIGQYFWMTYYLFPREIGTSLDHVTRQTADGFVGISSESNVEIFTNGFDVRMDVTPHGGTVTRLRNLDENPPINPDWFGSTFDLVMAFLLPLLTTLTGVWLFGFLFPMLAAKMPMSEQLACGMGLGMMAVAAVALGVKLCGFHGQGLVFGLTAIGAVTGIHHSRRVFLPGVTDGFRNLVRSPITATLVLFGLIVFLILFRMAGLEGLFDGDAVRWMLKAKIMYLYAGGDMVHAFSNPAYAHAHLDYPTLVPSLHAATYDSIGHVDEFVTKFWSAWMLLFLMAALCSLTRAGKGWFHAASFGLLGLLLLPAIQKYVQYEGSTMPMIFFTVMGFVQCSIWLTGRDRARLGLGLTLLFGAAMTKFEGFIFLALVTGWILLLPRPRPPLKPSPRVWLVLGFCFLAALPYFCLRVQIPVLNYESNHIGDVLRHPSAIFSSLTNWAGLFMIELARLFVNPGYATWIGDGGQFHWSGQWNGLESLYNPSTLCLAWLCLLLTVVLWFSVRASRGVLIWVLAMFLGAIAGITAIFVSFTSSEGLNATILYTNDEAGGRYVLPVLIAWFATILTLLFGTAVKPDDIQSPPATQRRRKNR